MLGAYDLSTVAGAADAIREVIQEIALLGLSRGSFFSKAAFYGGTALRIFYGLDRYSEDKGTLTSDLLRKLLHERIESLNIHSAKDDVIRFLSKPSEVNIWTNEFFMAVAEKMKFV
jgi:hypothetical protein